MLCKGLSDKQQMQSECLERSFGCNLGFNQNMNPYKGELNGCSRLPKADVMILGISLVGKVRLEFFAVSPSIYSGRPQSDVEGAGQVQSQHAAVWGRKLNAAVSYERVGARVC